MEPRLAGGKPRVHMDYDDLIADCEFTELFQPHLAWYRLCSKILPSPDSCTTQNLLVQCGCGHSHWHYMYICNLSQETKLLYICFPPTDK